MEINQHKCKHAACKCIVASDELFCSPYCEKRADEGDPACECGHDDCETSIADPVSAFATAAG
jgi:hypothetical protein